MLSWHLVVVYRRCAPGQQVQPCPLGTFSFFPGAASSADCAPCDDEALTCQDGTLQVRQGGIPLHHLCHVCHPLVTASAMSVIPLSPHLLCLLSLRHRVCPGADSPGPVPWVGFSAPFLLLFSLPSHNLCLLDLLFFFFSSFPFSCHPDGVSELAGCEYPQQYSHDLSLPRHKRMPGPGYTLALHGRAVRVHRAGHCSVRAWLLYHYPVSDNHTVQYSGYALAWVYPCPTRMCCMTTQSLTLCSAKLAALPLPPK